MNKNTKIVLGVVLVLAILLVAVGYAAIQTVNLNIEDSSAQATPDQANFTVKFTGTPTTSGSGTTIAKISETDERKASMNVTGLTAKGDTATLNYNGATMTLTLRPDGKSFLYGGKIYTKQ